MAEGDIVLGIFVIIVFVIICVMLMKPGMCGGQPAVPSCQKPMACSGAPIDDAAPVDAPFPVLERSTAEFPGRDLAPIITLKGQVVTDAPVSTSTVGKFGDGFETFKNPPTGVEASMWPSGAVGGAAVPGGQGTVKSTLNRYSGAMTQALNLRINNAGLSQRARAARFGANTNPIALAGQALGLTDSRGATTPLQLSSATNLGLPDGHPALEKLVTAGASPLGLPDGHPDLEKYVQRL